MQAIAKTELILNESCGKNAGSTAINISTL